MSVERCSQASLRAGEPLAGTATTAEHWLLVEVPGSWPRDVSDGEGLPAPAREAARAWLAETASSRLLFVRRPGRSPRRTLAFVVHAPEGNGSIRRFELDGPEALAEVDLLTGGDPQSGRLTLVCGHGSRDACCALHGTAAFGELADGLAEEELWISSHHGGHRFAPNVLALPHGLHFGRVPPGRTRSLVGQALDGTIDLDRYRGRTCYDGPVQAAECATRAALRLNRVDDLALVATEGATVRFRSRDGSEHAAGVAEALGPRVPASCGAVPEARVRFEARLLDLTARGDG